MRSDIFFTRKAIKQAGFSLTETMLALLLIGLLSSGIFYLIYSSNRRSMNSYHLYLAEQIAREPLEVLRSLGYQAIIEAENSGIADYRFHGWNKVTQVSKETNINKPAEVEFFERQIELQKLSDENNRAILVKIKVRPVQELHQGILLKRNEVTCSGIIVEQP